MRMSLDLPVYLINLDGSEARLAQASAQLEAAGIVFQRVPAFDGRSLRIEEFPDYDHAAAMAYMGRPLRGGEIGCYLSHLDCARRFLAQGAPYGLVLEDDMVLADGACEVLARMLDWLAVCGLDWDVVNVGANRLKYVTRLGDVEGLSGRVALLAAHYFPMTTTAILWSRAGAQRFVQGHRAIFAPVDNFLREWQCVEDRGLSVWPPLVATTGAESDIDAGPVKRQKENRSPFYGWLKQKRVWRNKLRAMRHLLRWRIVRGRGRR